MKTHPISRALSRVVIDGMLPLVDSRLPASRLPFDAPEILRPHDLSRAWGVTHFGVFVPDLPEPYRYLNTMTLLGASGAELFDLDHLAAAERVAELQPGELDQLNILADPAFLSEADLAAAPKGLF